MKGEVKVMKVGYIRVSSEKQNYDRQYAVLRDKVERVYCEKKSGKTLDGRTELQSMLNFIRQGDTVYVASIDRLGRNLIDILTISNELDSKGINLISIKEGIDTSTEVGRMYMVIAGILAEVELSLIKERTQAGREVAKSEGRTGGRPRIEIKDSQRALFEKYRNGEISSVYCQELLHMSRATFFRRVKEYKDLLNQQSLERNSDNETINF